MANDFTTPGMAQVNLGMSQWKSGKNFRQFIKDLNTYNVKKSRLESNYGMAGEALGLLGFLKGPWWGLATSLLGGWGGRMIGEHQAEDAPTREDYEIMYGEGALQDVESQLEIDEEQYSNMNQFLKSLGVTANVMMSLYGPQFLGELFGGAGATAATAKAGAASSLAPGVTVEGAKQAGQSALRDYLGGYSIPRLSLPKPDILM